MGIRRLVSIALCFTLITGLIAVGSPASGQALAAPLLAAGLVDTPYPVQQTARVYPADGAFDDQFGMSVAIDGNTAVIGAPYYDGEGAAFVYEYDGTNWVFSQKIPADPAAGDGFGSAVDISGDYIVVGAPFDFVAGVERGSAVVFHRTPSGWAYLSELVPGTAAAGDRFGFAVSVYGDTAVVGAPRDDSWDTDAGAFYIFKQGNPAPTKRVWTSTEVGAEYGRAVDIAANYIVVGAPFDDNGGRTNAGAALIFYGDGVTPWTAIDDVYADDPQAHAGFGYAVSTTGATTFVGAYTYDAGAQAGAGATDVFTRSGSGLTATWPWSQMLLASEPNTNDFYGYSVSVNGSVAVVGAQWDDGLRGSAHFYERTAGGWTLAQKVTGAGLYGTSVAASRDGRFAVGAIAGDGAVADSGDAYFYAVWDPVYRFYNPRAGTHFFTSSAEERDYVIATWPGIFSYEGVAYSVNPYGNKEPLHRFYKPSSSSHFYTADEAERDHVITTLGAIYSYDGPTYEVSPSAEAAKLPVYRFYNLRNGSHFYTADATERDRVISTLGYLYQYEGPAFWLGQ